MSALQRHPLRRALALCAALIGRVPPRSWPACGRLLRWLATPLLRGRRRVVDRNLALCFPELSAPARAQLRREALDASLTGLIETLWAWAAPMDRARPRCRVDGLEALQACLARGQGALLVAGHFTPMELAVRLAADALGRPLPLVVRRQGRAWLEDWIDRGRRRYTGETFGKKDVAAAVRALRQGQPVGIAIDQDFRYQHAFVPFFGVPAATLATLPRMARAGRAEVFLFWFRRTAPGDYAIVFEPWPGVAAGDPQAVAAEAMARLEARVRQTPAQYFWLHKRFKTRPPGAPPVY